MVLLLGSLSFLVMQLMVYLVCVLNMVQLQYWFCILMYNSLCLVVWVQRMFLQSFVGNRILVVFSCSFFLRKGKEKRYFVYRIMVFMLFLFLFLKWMVLFLILVSNGFFVICGGYLKFIGLFLQLMIIFLVLYFRVCRVMFFVEQLELIISSV